ncbi:MAG: hypothetical protein B7Y02_10185 [Rhodobacterales bacterium 17-64-5]|jgi:hypothetical protein|nr:MAG: hypothetical protein B7Y02_10185 [Rhodobacterales bacterium 17-64-5]
MPDFIDAAIYQGVPARIAWTGNTQGVKIAFNCIMEQASLITGSHGVPQLFDWQTAELLANGHKHGFGDFCIRESAVCGAFGKVLPSTWQWQAFVGSVAHASSMSGGWHKISDIVNIISLKADIDAFALLPANHGQRTNGVDGISLRCFRMAAFRHAV